MRVYQYCTRDRFHLPIYQADTLEDLAALVGIKHASAKRGFYRAYTGKTKDSVYDYVDIPDDDEEDECDVCL